MGRKVIKNKHNTSIYNRSFINIVVDIVLLLLLIAISSTGMIMKYTMPSGYAVRHEGARSYASDVLGLGRHGWGNVHWVLSVLFLLFLVLHIILHWKMIVAIVKRMVPNNTMRRTLWFILVVISAALLIFPFIYML